jgi:SPP1 family predicted phage head-tail adaptor
MKYNKNEVTGKMRDRIILQNVNRSRSLTGFASESWADVATIWAFAESKLPGSNETIIEGKNTAKNICDFTIRYNSSISEESRVVWGDKLYQVKNLKVSHDRRFISFQGVFYDSYILTGVNVAASVNGIATTSANLKLIMSVIGQANAIASTFGELTVFQQGVVEVAASVNALATSLANLTKVISISGDLAGSAFVEANASIVQNIEASVYTDANVSADLMLTKTLASSVTATATAVSILDVVTQGVVALDASVTATGEITANLLRIATLASSPTTAADTSAIATLTKVLEATATATAETDASAQLTIPVNASATATAETSANAQLTYTVNAEATATAETSAEAHIVRIISASATATAESSAEASFGVTFAANVEGMATVDNATIARAATMVASVTGQATVTNATLDVASSLILDLYPSAAVAYSLRKLRNAYTGSAIKVRASTSGAEGDVSFDVNNIISSNSTVTVTAVGTSGLSIGQQVTFSTFWNAGGSNQNVFVVTWYDQSGSSLNVTQSTQANQPQIVNSGVVILTNSKPSVRFNGTTTFFTGGNILPVGSNSMFIAQVAKPSTTANMAWYAKSILGASDGRYALIYETNIVNNFVEQVNEVNPIAINLGSVSTNRRLINTEYIPNTSFRGYINNSQVASLTTGITTIGPSTITFRLGGYGNATDTATVLFFNGEMQEFIFYLSNQSSNRTAINTNINTYYGIY